MPRPTDAADRPERSEPCQARTRSILLVEDDRPLRLDTARHLRNLGLEVREAESGPAAMLLLRSAALRFDLLVTEVGLPGNVNGRQIAEAAREHDPDLPVLFITGYSGPDIEGELGPGMAVLPKPFAMEALAARAQTMMQASLPA